MYRYCAAMFPQRTEGFPDFLEYFSKLLINDTSPLLIEDS